MNTRPAFTAVPRRDRVDSAYDSTQSRDDYTYEAERDGGAQAYDGLVHPCAAWPSRIVAGESLPGYLMYSTALLSVQTLWLTIGVFWHSSVFNGNVWFFMGIPFYLWLIESTRYALAHYGNAMAVINETRRNAYKRRTRLIEDARTSRVAGINSDVGEVERMFETRCRQLMNSQTRHIVLLTLQLLMIGSMLAACLVVQFVLSSHHISLNFISIPLLILFAFLTLYTYIYYRVHRHFLQYIQKSCCCCTRTDTVESV